MLSVKLFKINLPETYKSSNEEKTSKQKQAMDFPLPIFVYYKY